MRQSKLQNLNLNGVSIKNCTKGKKIQVYYILVIIIVYIIFREIGLYKKPRMWSNCFYQSLVGVQKLKLSVQLKGHEGCVNSLDFNSAGDIIVSGSDDLKICLWNWSLGKCILKYESGHSENVFQVKLLILPYTL